MFFSEVIWLVRLQFVSSVCCISLYYSSQWCSAAFLFAFCFLGLLSWSLQIRLDCCASFDFERWCGALAGLALSGGFLICRFCTAEWLFVLAAMHSKAAIFGATDL
jgi:hypothetical protein